MYFITKALFIFVSLFLFEVSSLEFATNGGEQKSFTSYWLRIGSEDQMVGGRVVMANPFKGCDEYVNADVSFTLLFNFFRHCNSAHLLFVVVLCSLDVVDFSLR
jgi:hypothetical protein